MLHLTSHPALPSFTHSFILLPQHAPASTSGRRCRGKTHIFPFSLGWVEILQAIPRTLHTKIQPKQGRSGTYRRVQMLPQGPLLSVILPLILPCSHKLALIGMRTFPVRGHPSSSPEQGLCHHVTHSPACMLLPNPAFHGLSATGAYPGGSQLEHSKTTSQ